MDWSNVGEWLKSNAGSGAALVGALLTGNIPAAVGLGVRLVAGATGQPDPAAALQALQQNPETLVRLRELAIEEQANINSHIERMAEAEFADQQAEHHETQETIRAGDKSEDRFVRWTRPGQSWASLGAAVVYAFKVTTPDVAVLGMLLTLPFAYAGLRTIQHWNETKAGMARAISGK